MLLFFIVITIPYQEAGIKVAFRCKEGTFFEVKNKIILYRHLSHHMLFANSCQNSLEPLTH